MWARSRRKESRIAFLGAMGFFALPDSSSERYGAPEALGGVGRSEPTPHPVPLLVELDALLSTDLTIECLFVLAKRHPLRVLLLPFWLWRGRAALRRRIAWEGAPEVATL